MIESDEKVAKLKVEVEIELENTTRLLGFLFVKHMQRVSDLLNDSRQFIPLQVSDGRIVHLQKTKIASVSQLVQEKDQEDIADPYEILGVVPSISDEQLKAAYHNLCSDYHPDKLQGLGLPPDFSEIANSRIVRIIDAYRRITAAREDANGKDPASPFTPRVYSTKKLSHNIIASSDSSCIQRPNSPNSSDRKMFIEFYRSHDLCLIL
jgi:hypothetical protein